MDAHHLAAGEDAVALQIMLVDDNLTFLASVKTTLKLLPSTEVVGEAHNGAQALELAQRLKPDLLLLDIVMPGQSGLDVVKTMQGWPQAPRVLFLTMHDNESYRAAAQALGALGLVDKANFVNELLPIISNLAAQSSEVSP
ncbi:response regulator transcription factor [Rhodoferax sp.]|uniref:response regulator n=1 Tax=Rhodoferax sp. TaxID=50421 RepID=UPI00284C2A8E|nr:response regulator transcription factor [Rhodoferax sp.]MDR3370336.1 response regulator transcription factor [Rhodoferax sp.]